MIGLACLLGTMGASAQDTDADGWGDGLDVCPLVADAAQGDGDGDGVGDACDACPGGTGGGLEEWGPPREVWPSGDAETLWMGDVDGDGDPDLLTGSYPGGEIRLYENVGATFVRHTVSAGIGDAAPSVSLADLDEDGDQDVLAASVDGLAWYSNLGAGTFGGGVAVPHVGWPTDSSAVDVDEDGDLDLVVENSYDADLSWHENLGGGVFAAEVAIDHVVQLNGTSVADLDADGDRDLLAVTNSEVWRWENVAGGAFGPRQLVDTVPTIQGWISSGPESSLAVDLDGDGLLEVLYPTSAPNQVCLSANLGGGAFAPCVSILDEVRFHLAAGDLDGDGDLDLAVSTNWIENLGGLSFSAELEVVTPLDGSAVPALGDVDGDGDLDFVDGENGSAPIWVESLVSCSRRDTDADGLTDAVELQELGTDAGDADTDGDGMDDGAEQTAGADPLDSDSDDDGVADGADLCPTAADPLQGDADGDLVGDACDQCFGDDASGDLDDDEVCDDVDLCVGDDVAGDADGDGVCGDLDDCPLLFDPSQIDSDDDGSGDPCEVCVGDDATGDPDADGVCDDGDLCPTVPDPSQVDADGDGDGDPCEGCPEDGDAGACGWRQLAAVGVGDLASDLDRDGDLDVLSSDTTDVLWFENLGGGAFGAGITVGPGSVLAAADIDSDGDADVIAEDDGVVGWYPNLGGSAFGPLGEIGPGQVAAADDLEGDGDVDVVVFAGSLVYAHSNLGGGAFAPPDLVTTAYDPVWLGLEDLDGDGDRDVLMTEARPDHESCVVEVSWFENAGVGAWTGTTLRVDSIFTSYQNCGPGEILAAGDLDLDGDVDVCEVSIEGELFCFWNLGGGVFTTAWLGGAPGRGLATADLDLDGDLDLASVGDEAEWLEATSPGVFAPWSRLEGQGSAFVGSEEWGSLVAADLDGDLDPDLLTASWWLPVRLSTDSDGDGLPDTDELLLALDPALADTDGDGLTDGVEECDAGTGATVADGDVDGLSDGEEVCVTDPASPDTDGDGLGDAVDGCPSALATSTGDTDGDGVCQLVDDCPDAFDPSQADSDGDGLGDACEAAPWDADADDDGLSDGDELLVWGTDPWLADSDGDGLSDGQEFGLVAGFGADTDPAAFVADADAGATTTDPLDADTDGDGLADGDEDADRDGAIGPSESDPADPDTDDDGADDPTDCAPRDPSSAPGAAEITADGVDQDCDGVDTCYADGDLDGVGSVDVVPGDDLDCTTTPGESALATDCDDGDPTRSPGASETPADGVDQDCDGVDSCYLDADGDGVGGPLVAPGDDLDCAGTLGEATAGTDCDDFDAGAFPGAAEVAADDTDQDCDGADHCYRDADLDGFGVLPASPGDDLDCSGTPGEAAVLGDCDDASAVTYPGAPEVLADGIDEDCDGGETCPADDDHDGVAGGATVASSDLDCDDAGEATELGDCDDTDPAARPGAPEVVGDGIDQDCDGADAADAAETPPDEEAPGGCRCASASGGGATLPTGLVVGLFLRRRRPARHGGLRVS